MSAKLRLRPRARSLGSAVRESSQPDCGILNAGRDFPLRGMTESRSSTLQIRPERRRNRLARDSGKPAPCGGGSPWILSGQASESGAPSGPGEAPGAPPGTATSIVIPALWRVIAVEAGGPLLRGRSGPRPRRVIARAHDWSDDRGRQARRPRPPESRRPVVTRGPQAATAARRRRSPAMASRPGIASAAVAGTGTWAGWPFTSPRPGAPLGVPPSREYCPSTLKGVM